MVVIILLNFMLLNSKPEVEKKSGSGKKSLKKRQKLKPANEPFNDVDRDRSASSAPMYVPSSVQNNSKSYLKWL